jgi:serine/threonine-protein kinase
MELDRLTEVDALFGEALTLDVDARRALLDARCGSDPSLRRAVEALLDLADRGGTDRLLGPVRAFAAEAAAPAAGVGAAADALAPGSALGAYRVIRTLGRGGMGVVLLAERSDGSYEHQVAIKVLPHHAVASPDAVRRFELERQILARLAHPHIAHLLDGGVDPRGLPYLVMEHVEGVPIDVYCDQHRLDVEARLRLTVAIARAVHAAHRSLVVHRDIKPSNVMVAEGGVVKLLDFGIAKLVDPADQDGALTATASRLLTPTYASPEQVQGAPITTASDVYQLGLLLYELLTGRTPQGSASARSLSDLVRAVCEREPPPPSRAVLQEAAGEPSPEEVARLRSTTPRRLARRLGNDLDAIVARALAKDPERRYASAEELASDLERHLSGRPVRARRPSFAYRAGKFVRRNRAASAAALLAVLLTVGYAVGVTLQARAIARERARAEVEAETAREVERFVLGLFEVSDPRESHGETVTARELLARGAERADRELAGRPEVLARMLSTLGHVQGRLGLLDEGIALQRRALDLRRRRFPGEHFEVAESAYRLGTLLRKKGDHLAAAPLLAEAVAVMRRARPRSNELADALGELGSLHYFDGDYDAALAVFTESLALRREIGTPAMIAAGLNNMGLVYGSRGDPGSSARYYREALDLNRAVHGARNIQVSVNLFNLGRALQDADDYRGAQPVFEEVLEIEREIYGPDHPEVGTDLMLVGNNLVKLGELERAEPVFAEARRIYEAKLDPSHPRIATLLHGIGQLRLAQGRLGEAEEMLRRSLEMRRARLGASHELLARVLLSLGECLQAQGRDAEAVAAWREALPMVERGKQPRIEQKLREALASAPASAPAAEVAGRGEVSR